jgi:hypothetical protein
LISTATHYPKKRIFTPGSPARHGVAFIGIGLVRPMVGAQVSGDMRRYLVITRHLNSQILSDLGATFQIDNLNYTPNKINDMSMPLNSSAGASGLSQLAGTSSRAQAAMAASSDITQIVTLAAALICCLFW